MKKITRVISVVTCIVMLFGLSTVSAFGATYKWPATKNIKTYVVSKGNNTTVYQTATSKKKYGTIYASDLITIKGYKNSRFQVTYPTKKGAKTGYIDKKNITRGTINRATDKWKQQKKVTVYRRVGGGATLGSIYVGDTVYRVNESKSYTQVIYPISGGYKMGWMKNSDIKKTAAKSASTTSSEKNISSKLTKMMNGTSYSGAYKLKKKYKGEFASEQCKGFAKSVHKKLFGYNIGRTKDKPYNYQINYSSSKTKLVGSVKPVKESTVKTLFSKARPGDFVQIRRAHGGSHSAIVVSKSSTGVTLYEANLDNANTIVKKTYTWKQLKTLNAAMSVYTSKKY